MKATFGEYGAYTTPGGIRFQKRNKLVSASAIPPEVVDFLTGKLTGERGVVEKVEKPAFPMPTEEEKARLRAESLQVKPELQAPPEKLAEDAAALMEDDFPVPADSPEAEEAWNKGFDPLPRTDEPVGLPVEQPDIVDEILDTHVAPLIKKDTYNDFQQAKDKLREKTVEPDFLESVSIHTAPLRDIAEALNARFGIYTVYLGRLPLGDEINPLTAENFSKYHLGIAYQAAIRAQNSGVLLIEPEEGRRAIDAGRVASENFQDSFVPQPRTFGEARKQNSFDYRTSVKGMNETTQGSGAAQRFDDDEDEMIVEPRIGQQIIRPEW